MRRETGERCRAHRFIGPFIQLSKIEALKVRRPLDAAEPAHQLLAYDVPSRSNETRTKPNREAGETSRQASTPRVDVVRHALSMTHIVGGSSDQSPCRPPRQRRSSRMTGNASREEARLNRSSGDPFLSLLTLGRWLSGALVPLLGD